MRILFPLVLMLLLSAAPAMAQQAKPPGLVDRLLSVLGNKNLPPMQIAPPPGAPPPANPLRTAPRHGGLEIATSFLPVYNLDRGLGDDDAPTGARPPAVLPFFASSAVTTPQKNILSIVVMIPDSDREAARAYAFARSAQDAASAAHPDWYAGNALVFTPQFLNPEDVAAHTAQWPDGGASLLKWAGAGWIYGSDTVSEVAPGVAPNVHGMSSYEVLDFALLAIARKELFPDLERVVIAGSGAGGDFVQRYAALGQAPDILANENIKVRFVAANAWSYLYFDKTRAQPSEEGVYAPTQPDSVFSEPKAEACPAYNSFPYGLESLPPYGRRQGETAIRLRYDSRVVLYLTGKNATHPLPDASPQACALILQGRNLNQRTQIFYQHLSRLYGENLSQTQRMYQLPGVAEEAPPLWASPCGIAALYGDGACSAETGDTLKVVP